MGHSMLALLEVGAGGGATGSRGPIHLVPSGQVSPGPPSPGRQERPPTWRESRGPTGRPACPPAGMVLSLPTGQTNKYDIKCCQEKGK